jgi:hypothetical protein
MSALLGFRRIGDVFGFAIFLRHREHSLYLNRTELFASSGNPVCDRDVVAQVEEQEQGTGDEQHTRPSVQHYLISERLAPLGHGGLILVQNRRDPVLLGPLAEAFRVSRPFGGGDGTLARQTLLVLRIRQLEPSESRCRSMFGLAPLVERATQADLRHLATLAADGRPNAAPVSAPASPIRRVLRRHNRILLRGLQSLIDQETASSG